MGKIHLSDLQRNNNIYTFLPIGSIIPFGGGSAPNGFLLCDGSKVSRTTYADLFSVIGTRFGSGDGVTTFNLPNFSGKFLLGCISANDVGGSGGSDTVTLQTTNLPSHSHGLNSHTHTFVHTHNLTPSGNVTSSFSGTQTKTTSTDKTLTGSFQNKNRGVGMQFTAGDAVAVYTSGVFGTGESQLGSDFWLPDHEGSSSSPCSMTIDCTHEHSYTAQGTVSSSFSGDSNTTSSQSESTTSSATGDTTSVGDGTAFSIIPSCVKVEYIIKY